MDVILPNAINAVGSLLALTAHFTLGFFSHPRAGHVLYVVACALLVIGSCMLSSWPVVYLNVAWGFIALWGAFNHIPKNTRPERYLIPSHLVCALMSIIGGGALFFHDYDLAGWMTTGVYLVAYLAMCSHVMSKVGYMAWCLVGFLMLVPHLLLAFQYAVLASELLGALISVGALFKIWHSKKKSPSAERPVC